jgi:hypothetical protein
MFFNGDFSRSFTQAGDQIHPVSGVPAHEIQSGIKEMTFKFGPVIKP